MTQLLSYRANLEVTSVEELVGYLTEHLAFQVEISEGDPAAFALIHSGEASLAIIQSDEPGVNSTTAGYVGVDDVDALHQYCVAQGLTVTVPLTDHPWGLRDFVLQVPGGHRLAIGQRIPDMAPEHRVERSANLLEQLDLTTLVGMPVDEARRQVESAGGRLRVVGPGDIYTLEFRPDRVTVRAEDGVINDVAGIG
jgi:hypothetical protein